jgi:putative membrane protein
MGNKSLTWPIVAISVAIPLGIVLLFLAPHSPAAVGFDIRVLPLVEALLNFTTFVLLLASLYFIRHGRRQAHKVCNLTAVALSVAFLVVYLCLHYLSPQAHYGGEGPVRYVYFFLLITHIILSAVIVPLVLVTLVRALKGNFPKHKKIARITWPIWVYVTLSGVIVYIMMAPYY